MSKPFVFVICWQECLRLLLLRRPGYDVREYRGSVQLYASKPFVFLTCWLVFSETFKAAMFGTVERLERQRAAVCVGAVCFLDVLPGPASSSSSSRHRRSGL